MARTRQRRSKPGHDRRNSCKLENHQAVKQVNSENHLLFSLFKSISPEVQHQGLDIRDLDVLFQNSSANIFIILNHQTGKLKPGTSKEIDSSHPETRIITENHLIDSFQPPLRTDSIRPVFYLFSVLYQNIFPGNYPLINRQ